MIILPNLKGAIDKKKQLLQLFKILSVGNFTSYNGNARNRIISLNSDSTIDSNFSIGTGFDLNVASIAIQSDGKILCGGSFTTYNGSSSNNIIRLNSDGTLDSSFIIGTGFNGAVNSIAIQSDGKILCGGAFTSYNGTARNRIARLNTDGTDDTSFIIGTGFSNNVNALAVQSDGKILCGGLFTTYNGTARNRIARLNTDGINDTSFNIGAGIGSGFNGAVNALVVQSDGKILCGGVFFRYNNEIRSRIARLNTDATYDTSFGSGSGFNSNVNALAVQSDGKILVGGNFTAYNATARNRIARLNTDGTDDTSFIIGTGFSNNVNALAVQSDGKILVGGNFTAYNGTSSNYIARLNTDGTYDSGFNIGSGFNSTVNALVIK